MFRSIGLMVLVAGSLAFVGCDNSDPGVVTNSDEIGQYLNDNPDANNTNLDLDETIAEVPSDATDAPN
ncbi:hypothetical protein [Rhodopirellula sallentina]|uniref:Secreted protein n=1 Tax=Rhodopirellula sallentina SM41 TaxID=1263870 RepID=M5U8X8_9BACT|nr:hypothetical protein [Rhodopirellula sallentina]EMI57709.1 secreted protein [Rhodopirellula sallentina SM41]